MRRILLLSSLIKTDEVVKEVERLVGKSAAEISVGIINEAFPPQTTDRRWNIENLGAVADSFGGRIEIVNLRAFGGELAYERLSNCDAVYCVGGSSDFLMHTFNETGFSEFVSQLAENLLWIGNSAGSMVLGHRPVVNEDCLLMSGDDFGVGSYLELVDIMLHPHVGRDGYAQTVDDLRRIHGEPNSCQLVGISDDAGIVIEGEQVSYIGPEALVV